ncbi:MAG: permease-like cell division protein FtsX [Wenzhouxiangella sp.]
MRRRGAWQGGLRAWGRRHAYSLLSSLGTLVRHPVASTMTVVVLAIALSLPAGLWVTMENAARISQNWERLDTLSMFLDSGADEDTALTLASRLSGLEAVAAVDPISPDDALAELGRQMGAGEIAGVVERNPLPWVLEVVPAPGADLARLAERLAGESGVDQVIVDLEWLDRLEAMIELIRQLVILLAVVFAVAVAFIVGNTIRMDIQNRQEEIEVLALVGATAGFIRRPFLYSGLWYGLTGGLLAWLLVIGSVALMNGPVGELSATYGSDFGLQTLPAGTVAVLLAGSGLLGVAGSWLAVGRHLRRVQP